MNKIKGIFLHCSATPPGFTAEQVHAMHIKKGWSGLGYNAVIESDGTLVNGRPDFWEGAHTYKFNKDYLGICMIGLEVEDFTDDMFKKLAAWCRYKMEVYGFGIDDIRAHNEVANKLCPVFSVEQFKKDWM